MQLPQCVITLFLSGTLISSVWSIISIFQTIIVKRGGKGEQLCPGCCKLVNYCVISTAGNAVTPVERFRLPHSIFPLTLTIARNKLKCKSQRTSRLQFERDSKRNWPCWRDCALTRELGGWNGGRWSAIIQAAKFIRRWIVTGAQRQIINIYIYLFIYLEIERGRDGWMDLNRVDQARCVCVCVCVCGHIEWFASRLWIHKSLEWFPWATNRCQRYFRSPQQVLATLFILALWMVYILLRIWTGLNGKKIGKNTVKRIVGSSM